MRRETVDKRCNGSTELAPAAAAVVIQLLSDPSSVAVSIQQQQQQQGSSGSGGAAVAAGAAGSSLQPLLDPGQLRAAAQHLLVSCPLFARKMSPLSAAVSAWTALLQPEMQPS